MSNSPVRFNIHGTNKNIKVKVLDDSVMRKAGFDRKNKDDSWLLVKSFADNADFWFEIWGDNDDDFCIEVLDVYRAKPYINNSIRSKLIEELFRLKEYGVIRDFDPEEIVFRYRYRYV